MLEIAVVVLGLAVMLMGFQVISLRQEVGRIRRYASHLGERTRNAEDADWRGGDVLDEWVKKHH